MVRGLGFCLAIALLGFGVTPLAAQEKPQDELKKIERELKAGEAEKARLAREAAGLQQRLDNLQQQLVSAARTVQDRELQVITLEARLADLIRDEEIKRQALVAKRGQFASILVALQRMATFPPEALLAYAGRPAEMVRGAILLRSVVPEIERQATALRQDLSALTTARQKTAQERITLANVSGELTKERAEISKLMAETRKLRRARLAERKKLDQRLTRLGAEAADLRDLMRKLKAERKRQDQEDQRIARAAKAEAARQAASVTQPLRAQRGKLPYPVVGRVVGRYGGALEGGLTRKGVEIRTRQGAQVIAPHGGKVVFADKFRGYGLLVILEHSDGYHTLLAGMGDIQTSPGTAVASGEPVGMMAEDGAATLYLELRRNGEAINPLPWLVAAQ